MLSAGFSRTAEKQALYRLAGLEQEGWIAAPVESTSEGCEVIRKADCSFVVCAASINH
jgi:hypothetical protein